MRNLILLTALIATAASGGEAVVRRAMAATAPAPCQ